MFTMGYFEIKNNTLYISFKYMTYLRNKCNIYMRLNDDIDLN